MITKPKGYDQAEAALAGDYKNIQPGGYICKVIKVEEAKSKTNRDMLIIYFDIAEGEFKDFYKEQYTKSTLEPKKWPNAGIFRQMMDGDSIKFLKGLVTAIEESNGFTWDWNDNSIKNKLFGGIISEEEYEKQDGSVGVTARLNFIRSVETIRDGDYKVPELKKLKKAENKQNTYGFSKADNISDDDLPF